MGLGSRSRQTVPGWVRTALGGPDAPFSVEDTMPPRIALIPSPFVGASSWAPVAALAPEFVAVDYGVVRGPDWYDGVAAKVVEQVDDRPWIGALHSGAGGFAPALAAAAQRLVGLIFVDAVLPYPGRSWLEDAPEDLAAWLRRIVVDGLLPRWNAWFPTDPTLRLILDEKLRQAFVQDLPKVPFAFLEARSPDRPDWELVPAAYLQLSGAYEEETNRARARGWPTRTERLDHLRMTSDPATVARLMRGLAGVLA
jgi:hypothetical protein